MVLSRRLKNFKLTNLLMPNIALIHCIYSRTSVARTLMARLPRQFQTHSWVPLKKSHSSRHYCIRNNLWWFSFFYIEKVYCLYSLESPQWGNSNENTQHTYMLEKLRDIPIMPPVLALWLTLISSNYMYPCLEHLFLVPKVFKPLKFNCIW